MRADKKMAFDAKVETEPNSSQFATPKKNHRLLWIFAGVAGTTVTATIAAGYIIDNEIDNSTLATAIFADHQSTLSRLFRKVETLSDTPVALSPRDKRAGYSEIVPMVETLGKKHLGASPQRPWKQITVAGVKLYPMPDNPLDEPVRAGITIEDTTGARIHSAAFPQLQYDEENPVAPLVRNMLLTIEDSALLKPHPANWNYAINYKRASAAALDKGLKHYLGVSVPQLAHTGGASTLAVQYIRNIHTKDNQTESFANKKMQGLTAMELVYSKGADTRWFPDWIVPAYLNTVSFAGLKGKGELLGPEGFIRFGRDFRDVNRLLSKDPSTMDAAELQDAAKAVRQAGFLIASLPGPSRSVKDKAHFDQTQDRFEKFISRFDMHPRLRQALLDSPRLDYDKDVVKEIAPDQTARNKLETTARIHFAGLVGKKLPEAERLDAKLVTTINKQATDYVAGVFNSYYDWNTLVAAGMTEGRRLSQVDYKTVRYSYLLTKIGQGDQPNQDIIDYDTADGQFGLNPQLDMNDGQYEMGSMIKKWVATSYLELAKLYRNAWLGKDPAAIRAAAKTVQYDDPITRWCLNYLADAKTDKSLDAMQDAMLEREYSGAPGSFFTGGGRQAFGNDEKSEGGRYTVRKAFKKSVNLVFIRIAQDVFKAIEYGTLGVKPEIFTDLNNAMRQKLLEESVYHASKLHIEEIWGSLNNRNVSPAQLPSVLAAKTARTPTNLAVILLAIEPDASFASFERFINAECKNCRLQDGDLEKLYARHKPHRMIDIEAVVAQRTDMSASALIRNHLLFYPAATYHETREAIGQINPALDPFKDMNKLYQDAKKVGPNDPLVELVNLTDRSATQLAALCAQQAACDTYDEMKKFIIKHATDPDRRWRDYKYLYLGYAHAPYNPDKWISPFDWQDQAYLEQNKVHPAVLAMARWQAQSPVAKGITLSETQLQQETNQAIRKPVANWLKRLQKQFWSKESFIAVTAATQADQLEGSRWLLHPHANKKTGRISARMQRGQNNEIWKQAEVDACKVLYDQWREWGYTGEGQICSLGIALGAGGMNPRQNNRLLAAFQTGGIRKDTVSVQSLQLAANNPVFNRNFTAKTDPGRQVMAPETAAHMKELMRDVVLDGTAKDLKLDEVQQLELSAKTGSGSSKVQVKTNRTGGVGILVDDKKTGDQYVATLLMYIKGGNVAKRSHMISAAAVRGIRNTIFGQIEILRNSSSPLPSPIIIPPQDINPAQGVPSPATASSIVPEFIRKAYEKLTDAPHPKPEPAPNTNTHVDQAAARPGRPAPRTTQALTAN